MLHRHDTKYFNTTYGITLRYPQNYLVKEGNIKGGAGLGYLGDIPTYFVAPGGVEVVTVEAPAEAYPGTDFVNAFFTINTNRYLTPAECGRFLYDSPSDQPPSERRISGVKFYGSKQGEGGMGHQWGGVYFHGFSGGVCYEIGYGLATAGYGAVEGMRHLDDKRVFSTLEAILQSLAIHTPTTLGPAPGSPSIQTFSVTPLTLPLAIQSYRVSWDVQGANANQISLSVSCFHDLMGTSPGVFAVAIGGAEGDPIPCDTVIPVASAEGSIEVGFKYASCGEIKETIRIFVAAEDSASKSLEIFFPALPLITNLDSDSGAFVAYGEGSGNAFRVYAGRSLLVRGCGFLPEDTLWIGSTSVSLDSSDSQKILFTIPTSLPAGQHSLYLTSDRGRSNSITVDLLKPRPQIAIYDYQPKIQCNGGDTIVPGQTVRVEGSGFLPTNTVWIGSMSVIGRQGQGSIGRWYLYFTAPASLSSGKYSFYVSNELGKSDVFTVTVAAAK